MSQSGTIVCDSCPEAVTLSLEQKAPLPLWGNLVFRRLDGSTVTMDICPACMEPLAERMAAKATGEEVGTS